LCLATVVVAIVFAWGCAGIKKAQRVPKDPDALYTKGIVLFNKGNYKQAEEVFTQLRNYFPSDDLFALKAELRIADTYFHRKEYPEAITRYSEFRRQNPFHPEIPYVQFQIGSAYFEQILSSDRDQEFTRKAMSAFENVVSNYPDTMFAEKAREKIDFCRTRLAEHENCVACYYMKKGKHEAAANRLSSVLAKYPDCEVRDEILYRCALALHKAERDGEALAMLTRLSDEYPQSKFTRKGEGLMAKLKTEGIMVAAGTPSKTRDREQWPTGPSQDQEFPFRISAMRTEPLVDQNAVLYSGGVVVRGETVTIRSDSVLLSKGMGDVTEEMIARGGVRVTNGAEEILCNKATWSPDESVVVMTGDPKVKRLDQWVRGDEMTMRLDSGQVEIKGEYILEQRSLEEG
jgi:outer membrane protein assembly factor BamD